MTLEAKNISCARGYRVLFSGLNFSLTSGRVLLVEGNNGSGKRTLLRILSGICSPDEGEVLWNGHLDQTSSEYSQQMVRLSHRNEVNDCLTAKENICQQK